MLATLPFLFAGLFSIAQQNVGIGTTTPHSSSLLELSSTTRGMLAPRMTSAQRLAIPSPAAGLLVYDTDLGEFQHHDGLGWRAILNQNYWRRSSSRNWLFSIGDSVGISTSSPDEKLHVSSGNIYIQDNRANEHPHVMFDIPNVDYKEGGLQFTRSGALLGSFTYINNPFLPNYVRIGVSSNGTGADLVVNSNGRTGLGVVEPGAKLHLRDADANEMLRMEGTSPEIRLRRNAGGFPTSYEDVGFLQVSGQNLRIGTYSSNNLGKFVIRTNGADRVTVDENGDMNVSGKVTGTVTGAVPITPLCYGMTADISTGGIARGTSNVTVTRVSKGRYRISCAGITEFSLIMLTPVATGVSIGALASNGQAEVFVRTSDTGADIDQIFRFLIF